MSTLILTSVLFEGEWSASRSADFTVRKNMLSIEYVAFYSGRKSLKNSDSQPTWKCYCKVLCVLVKLQKVSQNWWKEAKILVRLHLQNNLSFSNKWGFPEHTLPFHGLSLLCDRAIIAPRFSDVNNVSQDSVSTTDKSWSMYFVDTVGDIHETMRYRKPHIS